MFMKNPTNPSYVRICSKKFIHINFDRTLRRGNPHSGGLRELQISRHNYSSRISTNICHGYKRSALGTPRPSDEVEFEQIKITLSLKSFMTENNFVAHGPDGPNESIKSQSPRLDRVGWEI